MCTRVSKGQWRNTNTYNDVGRLRESFGIKISKLKAFMSEEASTTLECEHDIAPLFPFFLMDPWNPGVLHTGRTSSNTIYLSGDFTMDKKGRTGIFFGKL